ncbi:MAG TPA: hypothetical protein VK921_12555 [Anditalea sp.]|nr:hypothetical protein [Anditalea sp.]
MKKILVLLVTMLAVTQVKAQFIKERSIDVSIGLGLSAPYDEYDITGTGFYAQGEYVLSLNKWVDIRPYAGLILTKMSKDDSEQMVAGYKSTANAFLFGGKTRITAPIPWVAPYFEIGVGGSIGTFETFTPYTSIDESGLFLHIPFTIGLELGPRHNVNLEFTYYFHNSLEQFAGAAAFGLSFPLGNK